jgi:hypothetical protein
MDPKEIKIITDNTKSGYLQMKVKYYMKCIHLPTGISVQSEYKPSRQWETRERLFKELEELINVKGNENN